MTVIYHEDIDRFEEPSYEGLTDIIEDSEESVYESSEEDSVEDLFEDTDFSTEGF